MKIVCLLGGIIFYCAALYLLFLHNPNIGDGWYERGYNINHRMFNLVNEGSYNFIYTYLASITFSLIGTGIIIIGAPYDK